MFAEIFGIVIAGSAAWLAAYHICNMPRVFTKTASNPGPHVVIVGATHGDEQAGFHACKRVIRLLSDRRIRLWRGPVTIISAANPCGMLLDTRNMPMTRLDVNRSYGTGAMINQKLESHVDKADWVLDLHEGWGFRAMNPFTVGSAIYYGETRASMDMAMALKNKVNKMIQHDSMHFVSVRDRRKDIPIGSLQAYANAQSKNYILVETTGLYNAQPLAVRVEQMVVMILHCLDLLGMLAH